MPSRFPKLLLLGLALSLTAACQRTLIDVTSLPGQGQLAATATPLPSATPERRALLEEIIGSTEVRADASQAWETARPGVSLAEGSQVRTSGDGRVLIRLTEGSKVRLGPDTTVTIAFLNPYLDSLLTSLQLEQGEVWVMLKDGALDVETPAGIAAARSAYLNVMRSADGALSLTCLQGTCSFGSLFVPVGQKLEHAERPDSAPLPMTFQDYGRWGVNVPEATQLAYLATEAVVQGSATLPVMATATGTPTAPPVPTDTPAPSDTPRPNQPTPTPQPSPLPPTPTPSPRLSTTPLGGQAATVVPFTPIPPAPLIGRHVVAPEESLFCIARGYGVLPAAIAQSSGLEAPFTVYPGQVLRIPAVQWSNILPGPVCQPQFASPYPALPYQTATPTPSATPAGPRLEVQVFLLCVSNCNSQEGSYVLRVDVTAQGGVPPYTYTPAESFEVSLPHCLVGSGQVSVASADGQRSSATWIFADVACPATAAP